MAPSRVFTLSKLVGRNTGWGEEFPDRPSGSHPRRDDSRFIPHAVRIPETLPIRNFDELRREPAPDDRGAFGGKMNSVALEFEALDRFGKFTAWTGVAM